MSVMVNGSPEEIAGTVADLVAARCGDGASRGIAVAVNDAVVPRTLWEACTLSPGDRVEIVTAVQGG